MKEIDLQLLWDILIQYGWTQRSQKNTWDKEGKTLQIQVNSYALLLLECAMGNSRVPIKIHPKHNYENTEEALAYIQAIK
jgi:hypothetical protein